MEDRDFILRWAKKYRAIQELGGKCSECGNDNMFALDFHHKDPSKKEFGLSIKKHMSWPKIAKEIKKCCLLCRNCHSKYHSSEAILRFQDLKDVIVEKSKVVHKISRPPLNEEKIYQMLKHKYTIMGIAQVFKKDPSTILTVAERLERKTGETLFIRRDEYNNSRKKIDFDKLVIMYNDGVSLKEICKHFNASYATVTGRLSKLRKKGISLDIKQHRNKVQLGLTKPWNRDIVKTSK